MLVWNILLRVYFVVLFFFLGEEEGEILDFLACRRYEDETIDRCAIFFFMLLPVGYSKGGGSRYEDPFFAGIDLFSFQLG